MIDLELADGCAIVRDGPTTADADLPWIALFAGVLGRQAILERAAAWRELFG